MYNYSQQKYKSTGNSAFNLLYNLHSEITSTANKNSESSLNCTLLEWIKDRKSKSDQLYLCELFKIQLFIFDLGVTLGNEVSNLISWKFYSDNCQSISQLRNTNVTRPISVNLQMDYNIFNYAKRKQPITRQSCWLTFKISELYVIMYNLIKMH